jgi:hypothetical protein
MRASTKTEFKMWQPLPTLAPEPSEPPQGLGVRWVRGGGTHRFFERETSSILHRASDGKRCQPHSPPATALQDAGARSNVSETFRP